ncbi:MAG: AarF/UbiB family protein [Anaerococcus hydrogenalis]|uniref:ABC1 kinase family protein n=1 Tax=Anaerococcus hydrogenalis TaxID=33029 RepID=UPI0029036C06|nr:AarF/UbiB family protein [Anaerococcus hydrogenalis]MDU2582891.1 AarF/UbiB family protein [Anaerococcus hydrogenalis]
MGYNKRKFEIIREFLSPNLFLDIRKLLKNKNNDSSQITDLEREFGEKLRNLFENLGPVFVKFGQLLSTRRDIFSENIISELEKLQDDVKEEDFENIKEVFYKEFSKDIYDVFDEFEKKPLASGSIAQTHLATIKVGSIDRKVVVKVQRKDLDKRVKEDLIIMKDLYKKLESKLDGIESFNFGEIIEEFSLSLNKEIDFEVEKNNIKKYRKLNVKENDLLSPDVYDSYSSKKVLTLEYIEGKSIRSVFEKKSNKRKDMAQKIIEAYVNQMFTYGYFHADPHPGNIFVDKDLNIYLLDFGIVGNLSENYRYQIMKIFLGASFGEVKLITDAIIGMGLLEFDSKKIGDFEKRIQRLLDKYMVMSLNQMKLADLITDFYTLLVDYSIKIPSELTSFAKTVLILEGLIEKLVYKESFLELALPIAKSMIFKIFSPDIVVNRLRPKMYDTYSLIKEFPQTSLNILRQLARGDFRIIDQKSDLERKSYEKIENQKSQAIIFLGLSIIIGFSLLSLSNLNLDQNILKAILILSLSLGFFMGYIIIKNLFGKE